MQIAEILKKLKFKNNLKSIIINAPKEIEAEFKKSGFVTLPDKSVKYQFTLLFTKDKSEVETFAKSTIDAIEHDSLFWMAYPKGSSSIKTDINRDILWKLMEPFKYRPVSLIAVDKDWSAMRLRPVDKVKSK